MANTSPRSAWGATAYFTADGEGTRVALLPRYRRWLRGKLAADFSAGPFLLDSHHDVATRFQGVLVRSSITLSDLVSVSAQLDAVREDRGWAAHPYAGIRVGSYAAIPMTFFNFVYASVTDEGYATIYGSPLP